MDRLTFDRYVHGIGELERREPLFAAIVDAHGRPPLWERPPGFHTLVHIVAEQKISIDSARAVMQRIEALPGLDVDARRAPLTAAALLEHGPEALVACGLSRGKAGYCLDIARAVLSGRLDLERLERVPDDEVVRRLVAVRGIGPWTAGVYLTLALCRPDGWASGDRALAVGLAECEARDAIPNYPELDARANAWRPWRGVAARLLWHAYLERRARKLPV